MLNMNHFEKYLELLLLFPNSKLNKSKALDLLMKRMTVIALMMEVAIEMMVNHLKKKKKVQAKQKLRSWSGTIQLSTFERCQHLFGRIHIHAFRRQLFGTHLKIAREKNKQKHSENKNKGILQKNTSYFRYCMGILLYINIDGSQLSFSSPL